ncbi:MAG: helix-turn-helix transcriptional regulator [Candidatus Omnitrophota bacterium]
MLTKGELLKRAFIFTISTSIFDNLPIETLGQRIRKARLEQSLLQKDLALKLRVSKQTISNWEQDRNKPLYNRDSVLC